jgi:DNA-binding LacI/PurR family transcriptional regulator
MPGASLTTLRHPKWTVGATAARLLIERIGNNAIDTRHVVIPSEFIIRGTTRTAPSI